MSINATTGVIYAVHSRYRSQYAYGDAISNVSHAPIHGKNTTHSIVRLPPTSAAQANSISHITRAGATAAPFHADIKHLRSRINRTAKIHGTEPVSRCQAQFDKHRIGDRMMVRKPSFPKRLAD